MYVNTYIHPGMIIKKRAASTKNISLPNFMHVCFHPEDAAEASKYSLLNFVC